MNPAKPGCETGAFPPQGRGLALAFRGPVAQGIERPPPKRQVDGSNPSGVTRPAGEGSVTRSADLQLFLDEIALALGGITEGAAAAAALRIGARLAGRQGTPLETAGAAAERLPICDEIAAVLAVAERGPRGRLARAFGALQGQLAWRRRPSADPDDARFWHGHANAEILGPKGMERRSDLWIGASLMAPGVDYPRHSHAPEEIYFALSPGEWWNAQMDWTDPGPAGHVYNPPGIAHAMRSGSSPMLALWVLPL